jgi:putative Mg2+ transporter-C (MgtC) family protein
VLLTLRWEDIALRLVLTVIAGSLIGINRSEGGHPAGQRTTLLVSLAASIAMIQANLLMAVSGKTTESFAVLDLMRLPLGILTGMGFIGAGAILRRGDLVHGPCCSRRGSRSRPGELIWRDVPEASFATSDAV